jgi:hypothetical protein
MNWSSRSYGSCRSRRRVLGTGEELAFNKAAAAATLHVLGTAMRSGYLFYAAVAFLKNTFNTPVL